MWPFRLLRCGGSELPEVTSVKTKSGTTVYAQGGSRPERSRAMDQFLKFFNRDFTISEQKTIGNIWYDLKTGKKKNLHGQIIAETGTFVGPDAKKMNPTKKKMVDVHFANSKDVHGSESTVVHEMIHARMFMQGIPGKKHNEKKIDFEMVGRLSREGLKKHTHGYYFNPLGNPHLGKKKIPNKEKLKIAEEGMVRDRRLLTGSLNTSIKGKVAEKRADRLFPESFLNQKKF